MSTFDPQEFLNVTLDAPLVKRPPIPVGDYVGIVGDPEVRQWVGSKDPTLSGIAVDYPVELQLPPQVVESLNLNSPTLKVKHGMMVDTLPDGKTLDMAPGKNGALRKFRDALDLNKPGDKFNFRMATGRPIRVKISHREYPPQSGDFFEDVAGVAKA